MLSGRVLAGMVAGVLVTAGALVAPAFGASEQPARIVRHAPMAMRGLGGFTPAAADPRLAALFARGGVDAGSFRFTPAETRRDTRAVTVAVRARTNRNADTGRLAATTVAPRRNSSTAVRPSTSPVSCRPVMVACRV